MELCMRENAVFFLHVNILTVWSPAFLAARHTTVCLDLVVALVLAWVIDRPVQAISV